ncbi:MAG: cell wall-binding repeat-containing protein [Erysipelotrichaceae bacterium]|nr:cell wall-binding repeat-containing protein [Erysipelotrichaceae bacterium]
MNKIIRSVFTILLSVLMVLSSNAYLAYAAENIEGSISVTADDSYGDKELEFGNITAIGGDALKMSVKDGKTAKITAKSINSDRNGIFSDELTGIGSKAILEIDGDIKAGISAVEMTAEDHADLHLHVSGAVESEGDNGIWVRAYDGATAEILTDYYVRNNGVGIGLWCYSGSSGVLRSGSISGDRAAFSTIGMDDATVSANIDGDIETTGENSIGISAASRSGSSVTVSQKGNILSSCDGIVASSDTDSSLQVNVIGNIEGAREGLRVETYGKDTSYTGINADVIIHGTVSGGTVGISREVSFGKSGTYRITVWKVVPNAEGHVAMEGDYDTLFGTNSVEYTYDEEFERSINYIMSFRMKAGQYFTPVGKNGAPLEMIGNYYVAHEGDYVSLRPQTEGGVITAAYNNGELLDRDEDGNFYLIVPKGGGVYFSADIEYPAGVTSVSLDKTSLTLTEGESAVLKATVLPENAADKSVTWSSSDPSTVKVDASGNITALKEGSTVITVTTNDGGKKASCNVTVTKKTPDTVFDLTRLSGKDRYLTSLKAADELKSVLGVDKFDAVILATGKNFADALGGGYLAAKKSAPILLTSDTKYKDINAYINENLKDGGTVYVLGGTGAVSDTALEGLKVTPKRLSGKTRYDTNLAILNEAGVSAEDILICSGDNFADALAASASGRPMLLVNTKKDTLTDSQKDFLSSHSSNAFYILGGTGAVSQTLEDQVAVYHTPERVKGSSRYQTSVEIAKKFFSSPEKALIAYSDDYPDGLCAGPLGYALKSPILLTKPGKESSLKDYCSSYSITNGYIIGGEARIPDDSARDIFSAPADTVVVKK